jgi:myosin heavy subunit
MLAMLEELRRDQILSEMAFKARELAEKQDNIISELTESENESECAREEMKLSDEIKQLESDLESATDDFAKTDAETAANLNDIVEETADKELPEMAAVASREMNSGQTDSASKKGEQISDDLNELADQLERMQQQYRESQKQQLMADVQGIVERLLFASFRLESFAYESYLNPRTSLPARQRNLGGELAVIAEELADLAARSFFISAALGESVAKASDAALAAGDNLALGNNVGAAKNDLEAMAQVNLVALALLDAKSSISNSSSSMGLAEMMEQMKAMAEAQKGINNQSDSAMQMMPGMKPGDLQSMLEAMAAEQAMLRREMQKMMNRMGDDGEKMGDLAGMMDEMRELEEMLKDGQMDERVREKQDELLERMLSTHRAMRNKGKSSKRRSEVAHDYTPVGVPQSLPARMTAPRRANPGGRSDANSGYIAPEYDEATSDYFRRLAGGN